jgi:two-component system, LuxR family, sensor kinase FixL
MMSTSQSFSPPARSPAYRYGLAIVAVAIALGIKLILLHFEVPYPLSSSFLAAIAIAFWFGGDGPGVSAVVLSAAAFVYFVVPYQIDYRMVLPDGSVKAVYMPATFITTLPYLVYFVLVAITTSWFSSSRRSAERLLNQTRSDLEVTVLERTADLRQANQELQAEVAERKRVEERLRERAQLLDLTHDSVFVRDMRDVITYWNRGAEERYGWTSKEALGQISHDITGTVFPAPLKEIMTELTNTGRWEGELVHTRRDGSQVVVASRWALQRDEDGNALAILETNNDITERKHAEDALHKAQEELAHVSRVMTMGELVASIAHEVNQPLGAIVTNGHACVRLLSRDAPDLDKSLQIIERMIKDGMRASEVIKRIRDLLHKAPSEKAPLNINEVIQEVIALVSSDVLRTKIKLRTDLAADLPPVEADRIQLQQVILNLILNAKDALSAVQTHPRELVVTSRKDESGEVLVAVRDTGNGLDPTIAARIFEPFYTTKPKGMGLGLSISRTIIEAHGGRLWATQNEEKGATIQFALPPGISQSSGAQILSRPLGSN